MWSTPWEGWLQPVLPKERSRIVTVNVRLIVAEKWSLSRGKGRGNPDLVHGKDRYDVNDGELVKRMYGKRTCSPIQWNHPYQLGIDTQKVRLRSSSCFSCELRQLVLVELAPVSIISDSEEGFPHTTWCALDVINMTENKKNWLRILKLSWIPQVNLI